MSNLDSIAATSAMWATESQPSVSPYATDSKSLSGATPKAVVNTAFSSSTWGILKTSDFKPHRIIVTCAAGGAAHRSVFPRDDRLRGSKRVAVDLGASLVAVCRGTVGRAVLRLERESIA